MREGLYYRLSDPAKEAWCAWAFVSEDRSRALFSAVLREGHANECARYVRLRGLTSGARYRVRESGKIYPADALMEAGFPLPLSAKEHDALQLHFERI